MGKNSLETVDQSITAPSYVITSNADEFLKAYNAGIAKASAISRSYFSTFDNILPGISARPQYTRDTYEHFRPNEALPKNYKDTLVICDSMYYGFTLVRNVIDLMSDFACQGITLVHPVPSVQRFYNAWFEKVGGFHRSERFLNYLFRHNMVCCEAMVGTVSKKQEEEYKSLAEVFSREIPLDYVFHHPALVFAENPSIINDNTQYYLLDSENAKYQNYINNLKGMGSGKGRPLPKEKTAVHYYKRDDWQVKPIPFLYPLVKHAIMLEKLNLADSAALDGAISNLRIIKLGSLEYKLAPTDSAVAKLNDILQSNVGGGTIDLIWGPDIELIESKTTIHQFLGEEKYKPHLHHMYVGLGIPPSLAGTGGTGTTNNYISIKVLTKRLQYGRRHLIDFWTKQIKWVQKAMGFARPAKIQFDFLDLGDEEADKKLLIQMADRNLISDEKLQTVFGHDPDMEKTRLNKEHRERKSGRRVAKLTAMQDSLEDALKKIALQKGVLTPDHLEMGYKETGPKPEKLLMLQLKPPTPAGTKPTAKKKKTTQTRGRPSGSQDKTKRKQKAFKPKIKAALSVWATEAQKQITDIVKPKFLKIVNKSNLRQLTSLEAKQLEKLTSGVLYNCTPFDTITKSGVSNLLEKPIDEQIYNQYLLYSEQVSKEIGRILTLDETRQIHSLIYSTIFEETLNGEI